MATFVAHGIIGAASLGWISKRFFWYLIVIGFVLGSLPDSLDWLLYALGPGSQYGSVYQWFHNQMPYWLIVLVWPTGLHVLFDKIFHAMGPDWWPRLWWLEVLMWVIGLLMIWNFYRRKVYETPTVP